MGMNPYSNNTYRGGPGGKARAPQANRGSGPGLTPEIIAELVARPELRLVDDPGMVGLAQVLSQTPDDRHLSELFMLHVQQRAAMAQACGDPFGGYGYPLDSRCRNL